MKTRWNEAAPADTQSFAPALVFEAGERNHHISNTAYPIAHGRTWGPYRVAARDQHRSLVEQAFADTPEICLYAHIPFCEKRCSFCEYTVVGKDELGHTRTYMDHLLTELDMYSDLLGRRRVTGFDIGGGTPSFVPAEQIQELVELARLRFDLAPGMRISIETTPRIAAAEPDKIRAYKRMGIDRISMGIQVIQPDLLKILNRDSNGVEHHHQAVKHIRQAGFDDFNVDLMYGFAGQSLESWQATLEHALQLSPEAITLYRMRYKLTRISHQADQVELEQVRELAAWAKLRLKQAGYLANPGKNTFCRVPNDTGTSDYICRRVVTGIPYLGLGLGAQTFTHNTISYNDGAVAKNLMPYFRSLDAGHLPLQDLYALPRVHMMAKMICVSFYFGAIHRAHFANKFGLSLEEAYPTEIAFAIERGLMQWTEQTLAMTPLGERHFSGLCALFHAPSVKQYLLERDPEKAEDMHLARRLALKVAG
jgi:oxygen-independent coproporphyrinogen-3 oxidase